MATTVKWLETVVHLTDKDRVATLQAAYPAGAKGYSPIEMATLQSAPIQETDETFAAPCTRSAYFIPGSAYPRNVASFTRKSGGWFGLSFLFGDTTIYRWYARFAYAAGAEAEIGGTPTEVVAIAQRRGMMSFDAVGSMEQVSGGIAHFAAGSRDASRHVDGGGFSVRIESSSHEATINPTEGGAAATNQSWERFYMRVRKAPTLGLARFFRIKLAGGASRGFSLDLTTDMRVQFKNISDAGVEVGYSSTTEQLELNRWYRFDVVWKSGAAGSNQTRVYIGRKLVMTQVITASGGINTASNHETSHLGSFAGWVTNDTPEFDFDDWVCADWPTEDSGGRFVGKDWLNGSRVKFVPLSAMGPGNAWTGPVDHRLLNANRLNVAGIDATSIYQSSTSGDALVGTIDAAEINNVPGSLGAIAFYVVGFLRQAVAGAGTLGWRFDGLLDLAALATQSTSGRWERRLYRPSGLTEPIADLTPLEVHHIKAANANLATCSAFGAVVELIGTFGDEDVPEDTAESDIPASIPPRRLGSHNAPYPQSPWASQSAPVQSPVVVHSGTYVGNGTITELTFRSNVSWLFIRRVAAVAGNFWFSSGLGGHFEGDEIALPGVHALVDPSFVPSGVEDTQEQRVVVRLVGDNIAWNQNAATYEYIAVMDPGARFMLNGAIHHPSSAVSEVNALAKTTFTPEYAFFHAEASSGTGYQRSVKGIGHTGNNGSILNLAEAATFAAFAAGQITSLASLHVGDNTPTLFSAWRRDDQSGDANRFKVVKIGSYTGDGAASRTIGFENAVGLRPLFAIVTPHNALSYFRDPSNLTNTSNAMGTGTSSTTAITAGGLDSFTVGSTLNSNGIVYDYFVILGSATAGNGGWSIDGEFAYLEPDWTDDDEEFDEPPDFEDPDNPDPVDPDPDPGEDDTDDCEAGEVCVAATTRVVNLALGRIGVSKTLSNYCTQDTREAITARIHYEPAVRATLRAFPWPFATRYATLALAATQPSNADWLYAYREPADCIFPRRLVVARGTAVDPTPPPMMFSSDASGRLIFTNQANAVLEYTARPNCPAYTGEPLFLEALEWKLAAELAPSLTRMSDREKECLAEYKRCIDNAHEVIKPGVPGLRTAADPTSPDADAECITANIQVVNMALVHIGARTIANLSTEQSKEAIAANLVFEDQLQAVLREHPWAFATGYNDALTLVDGAFDDPANPDWYFSYRVPDEAVFVRRIVTPNRRSFEPDPEPFRFTRDDVGGLLLVNIEDPVIEFTTRPDCAVAKGDALFRDALAWRLAYTLAPSLAQVDPDRPEQHGRGPVDAGDKIEQKQRRPNLAAMRRQVQRDCWAMYQRALAIARGTDANERQVEKDGDAEWIRGRN